MKHIFRHISEYAKGGEFHSWSGIIPPVVGDILKQGDFYVCIYEIRDYGNVKAIQAFFCDKNGNGKEVAEGRLEAGRNLLTTEITGTDWKDWEQEGHRKLDHVSVKRFGKDVPLYISGNEKIDAHIIKLNKENYSQNA